MRMKRTMDILLASRTLEQVDEFRRRSGPDCFFFFLRRRKWPIDGTRKKGQQSQSNWVKKKKRQSHVDAVETKKKNRREREKVLILFSSVSTGHSAGPCAIFSAASSHAAEDDNYLIVLAGVSVKVVVR